MLSRERIQNKKGVDRKEEFFVACDGTELFARVFTPDVNPRGVINIIHSLGEHSGRYSGWAGKLADEGYIVRSFDLRRHGKSDAKGGNSFLYSKHLSDIRSFLEVGKTVYVSLPFFLYGQGFGGNLVLNYAIQDMPFFDGIIVTSPWLELLQKPSKYITVLMPFICSVLPKKTVKSWFRLEDLSRDLKVFYNYKTDPLVRDRINLGLFRDTLENGKKAMISIYKINTPLLVMHGDDDKISSCKASRKFVQNAGNKTKFLEWEGCYHELHNDLRKEEILKALLHWLNYYANPQIKQNA
jgi:acylglycerol lipase